MNMRIRWLLNVALLVSMDKNILKVYSLNIHFKKWGAMNEHNLNVNLGLNLNFALIEEPKMSHLKVSSFVMCL